MSGIVGVQRPVTELHPAAEFVPHVSTGRQQRASWMQSWWGRLDRRQRIRAVVVPLAAAIVAIAAASSGLGGGHSGGAGSGPSESYLWGEKAGNSSVSLAHSGVSPSASCKTMIQMGMMFSDDPVLNPTPPPKDYDMADIQEGCLAALHKQLGY